MFGKETKQEISSHSSHGPRLLKKNGSTHTTTVLPSVVTHAAHVRHSPRSSRWLRGLRNLSNPARDTHLLRASSPLHTTCPLRFLPLLILSTPLIYPAERALKSLQPHHPRTLLPQMEPSTSLHPQVPLLGPKISNWMVEHLTACQHTFNIQKQFFLHP